MIGPSWFSCCVGKKYTANTGAVRDAEPRQGPGDAGLPRRLRPRVPATSSNKALAADWIKDFTSTSSEKALQAKGNIPNATNLLGNSVNERAAARSWFVPTAKHWVDVENGNILRNMLAQILTGKLIDPAGSRVGQRQHRIGAEPVVEPVRDSVAPMAVAAETTLQRSRRRRRFWRPHAPEPVPYGLILPVVVVIGLDPRLPALLARRLSTQQYGLFELIRHKGTSVGLHNYGSVLHDQVFWHTLLRTVVFTVANVCADDRARHAARAAARARRARPCASCSRSGLVLVWSMPVVVAVQVWYWMTNFENGIVNYVLTQLHIGDFFQHDWYATTFSQLSLVTLLIVWGALPFVVITLYAGLAQVPHDLVEAAEIDGARPWRVFLDITFPILKPILLILTSLSIIWDFGVFTQPYLLIGQSKITTGNYLMSVYLFEEGYFKSDFGRGAAISILMLLIVAVLSVVYVRKMVRIGAGAVSAHRRRRSPHAAGGLERRRHRRLRRDGLPGLLDDLDRVQVGRPDHQPDPDLVPAAPDAAALPRRDRQAVLLGGREEQPHRRRRHRRDLDRARVPRGGRARAATGFTGRKLFIVLVIGIQMLPQAGLIIPLYVVLARYHQVNALSGRDRHLHDVRAAVLRVDAARLPARDPEGARGGGDGRRLDPTRRLREDPAAAHGAGPRRDVGVRVHHDLERVHLRPRPAQRPVEADRSRCGSRTSSARAGTPTGAR